MKTISNIDYWDARIELASLIGRHNGLLSGQIAMLHAGAATTTPQYAALVAEIDRVKKTSDDASVEVERQALIMKGLADKT